MSNISLLSHISLMFKTFKDFFSNSSKYMLQYIQEPGEIVVDNYDKKWYHIKNLY